MNFPGGCRGVVYSVLRCCFCDLRRMVPLLCGYVAFRGVWTHNSPFHGRFASTYSADAWGERCRVDVGVGMFSCVVTPVSSSLHYMSRGHSVSQSLATSFCCFGMFWNGDTWSRNNKRKRSTAVPFWQIRQWQCSMRIVRFDIWMPWIERLQLSGLCGSEHGTKWKACWWMGHRYWETRLHSPASQKCNQTRSYQNIPG